MPKKLLCLFLTVLFIAQSAFCDTATSYDDINFPQWTKDLRRTEIIAFGSLPFVTLWTTLGYSLAVKGSFHNPLDKSTSSFTQSEQKQIMAIAAATSIGLGLFDLTINLISRQVKNQKKKKIPKTIVVVPFSQEVREQIPAPPKQEEFNEEEFTRDESLKMEESKPYLIKGMEDALF